MMSHIKLSFSVREADITSDSACCTVLAGRVKKQCQSVIVCMSAKHLNCSDF